MLNLTCATEIKGQDLSLPLAIVAQAFLQTSEEQKNVIWGIFWPVPMRALVANSQPFFLYLDNKTTFCFPIKKHPTIDSLTFSYIN